ncbi:hypothetical protein GC163_05185 [bacterium]|nr:hypothetical protein [bacterium]
MRGMRGLLLFLDGLDDDVPPDAGTKWIYGAVTPLLFGLYASSIFYSGYVTIGRRFSRAQVQAPAAYWLAGAVIGFALLLHCRNFWSNTRRLAGWSELGILVCLIATVACLIAFVWTAFRLF